MIHKTFRLKWCIYRKDGHPNDLEDDPMTNEQANETTYRPSGHHPAAWVLIALGSLLLLSNLLDIGGGIFFIVLGGAFLAGHLSTRNYGLLIPAMILIGMGAGISLSDLELFGFENYWVPFCLGIGFVAIYLIDRTTWFQSGTWPLWPGGFLVLISVWGVAYEAGWIDQLWWDFVDIMEVWWPALIILWGVTLLRRRKKVED
jgi:hypothetical protein